MTVPTLTTHTLAAPGATITFDVRGELGTGTPLLVVGCPMGADGFTTLAGLLADRPVITYDPRGVNRSTRSDGTGELSPDDHAADLERLVGAIGGGPVDVFATSGGAVNALAWVSRRGGRVRTLVAHEPPLATILPDADAQAATIRHMREIYRRDGFGPAMATFLLLVGYDGSMPEGYRPPAVDPARFGLPTEDDGRRDDPLLAQNIGGLTGYRPDVEALRASATRIVLARGAASGRTTAARGADAMAALLGAEPVTFPGNHGGFMGDEYGHPGEPEAFAARLRDVLAG